MSRFSRVPRQKPRRPQADDRLHYRELSGLWLQWLQRPNAIPLDRWLRKHSGKNAALRQQPSLALALYQAQRFLQLACALEHQQRQEQALSDGQWQAWDKSWQPADADQLDPHHLWHWVQQRCQENWRWPDGFRNYERRTEVFRQFRDQAEQPLSAAWLLWHGIRPSWMPALRQRQEYSQWSDEQFQQWLQQQSQAAPTWLRINPIANHDGLDVAAVARELQQEKVSVQRRGQQLCALGGRGLSQSQLYKAGVIEIQDLASQHIVAAVAPKPGEKIWDACAGAGGKAIALASQMNNKGAVIATDLYEQKLVELKRRAKRGQLLNIRSFVWDGQQPLKLPQEIARQQGFDKVLVDAPCSSSGTWRRNPDARWRLSADDNAELMALQQRLLTLASQSVRPGGELFYATCSWQVEENEQQVADFMQQNDGWQLLEQTMLGAPEQDADTMFVARLKRL